MSKEKPRVPNKWGSMSINEQIAWLNQHYPVRKTSSQESPSFNPNWYEELVPVNDVRQLTPAMFGVVDPEDGGVHYGWARYDYSHPDNRKIQERAAMYLMDFTHTRSWKSLWNVYSSLESDGYASKGYQFRAHMGLWDLPVALREFQAKGDIKGAAQHTARMLFTP